MKQINVKLDRKARVQLEDLITQTGLSITMIVRWALNELHGTGPHDPRGLGVRAQIQHELRKSGQHLVIWAELHSISEGTLELVLSKLQQGAGRLEFRAGTMQDECVKKLVEAFSVIMDRWV